MTAGAAKEPAPPQANEMDTTRDIESIFQVQPGLAVDEPWAAHARHWSRLGPPLRPSVEDVQRLHGAWTSSIDPAVLSSRTIVVLMLGVTPELASHHWARGFQLWAVDASEDMIKGVWPGDTTYRRALCGSWLDTPFADASFDLIVSDCGLTPLAACGQVAALGNELRRLIRQDGRIVMRHLARPAHPTPLDQLVQLAESGALRNFHELKLRFLFAMAASMPVVRLGEVWECFERNFPNRRQLAERLGCTLEVVATIDAYRDRDACYVFPTLPELALQFSDFSMKLGPVATYPLAECCPVFTLAPHP